MWAKRKNLHQELMGIETPPRRLKNIDYQKIIHLQQETIKILQKEITHLRTYLAYVADFQEENKEKIQTQMTDNLGTTSVTKDDHQPSKKITGLKGLISQIMKLIKAKCPDEIMPQLKNLQEKANRKIEPVFIQKVKEKEVPIVIVKQVQKIVQKIKIQQKIVYLQKPEGKSLQDTTSSDSYSFINTNDNFNSEYYPVKCNNYYNSKRDFPTWDNKKKRQKSDRVKRYKEKI